MTRSIILLLLAAVIISAVSKANSTTVKGVPIPQLENNTQNLRLNAMTPGASVVEPGKMRIPIPVDEAIYEVVVVTPGMPRLIALGDDTHFQTKR